MPKVRIYNERVNVGCPHCNFCNVFDSSELPEKDGDNKDFICGQCEKQYTIYAFAVLDYSVEQ